MLSKTFLLIGLGLFLLLLNCSVPIHSVCSRERRHFSYEWHPVLELDMFLLSWNCSVIPCVVPVKKRRPALLVNTYQLHIYYQKKKFLVKNENEKILKLCYSLQIYIFFSVSPNKGSSNSSFGFWKFKYREPRRCSFSRT